MSKQRFSDWSFDVPPIVYLFAVFHNHVQEQESQGDFSERSITWLLWAIRSWIFHHLSDHNMPCDRSRLFMSEQSLMGDHILSFHVPPYNLCFLLECITRYKSRNLKGILACDRWYRSYERSEVKIFIIWAIIKFPVIDQGGLWAINVIYERTESHGWSYFVFSCMPPIIYVFYSNP